MSNKKNVRRKHRCYVTRTIKRARDINQNFEKMGRFRLKGIRASLKEKSDVLKEFDVKSLMTLDGDAVDNDIDSSSDFSLQILEIIFEIDSVLRKVLKDSLYLEETIMKFFLKLPYLNIKFMKMAISHILPTSII